MTMLQTILKLVEQSVSQKHQNLLDRIKLRGIQSVEDAVGIGSTGKPYAKIDLFLCLETGEYSTEPVFEHCKSFEAGNFIPETTDIDKIIMSGGRPYSEKYKIKISDELVEFLQQASKYRWSAKLGKAWTTKSGEIVAYLYITKLPSEFTKIATEYIIKHHSASEEKTTSHYMVEGRYEFEVKLLKINIYPCQYSGYKSVGVFVTPEGNIITGNPTFCNDENIGESFKIKGTVSNVNDGFNVFKRPILLHKM